MRFQDVLRLRHGRRSMRGSSLSLLFFLALFGLATTLAHAQSASVNGQVVDQSGALVRNVEVTLTNQKTNTVQHAKTNSAGMYILPFVTPGTYSLHAETTGFKPYTQTNITISTAQSLELDIRIEVGDTSESVTVDGSGEQINTIDASVSTVVDRKFVENIPLNGRSFQSLMTAVPGVTVVPSQGAGLSGELSVNGQRTESNYFLVDGVSANTGSQANAPGNGAGSAGVTPNETVLGTTQSIVSLDDLQEFRAVTSTYSAEYGRGPGGQFNFTTRSGTNQWTGTAFDYLRNSAMDANNWFNNHYNASKLPLRQNDFGGTLGGPVLLPKLYDGRDKTFFFFSYEDLRLVSSTASTVMDVPSLALRVQAPSVLQPLLNAFPLPNGPDRTGDEAGLAMFTSGYSSPSSLKAISIRLDQKLPKSSSFFARYSWTPSDLSTRDSIDLASVSKRITGSHSLTLGDTQVLSQKAVNELRVNTTWSTYRSQAFVDTFGGATPLSSSFLNSIPGYGETSSLLLALYSNYGGLSLSPGANKQFQFNIRDTVSVSLNRHNLKFGIDYRRLANNATPISLWERVYYGSASDVIDNTPYFGVVQRSNFPMKPVISNTSLFAQDEWRVNDRFNLSFGVRWELNPAPRDADGHNPYTITSTDLLTVSLASPNSPLWRTTYANFAPRLGLAYRLGLKPGYETVFRAGIGLFYDTANVQSNGGYSLLSPGISTGTNINVFPADQSVIDSISTPHIDFPYDQVVNGYDPNLKLPRTAQWNGTLEQSLGRNQTLTVGYVASVGKKLLMQRDFLPGNLGNPNFDTNSGFGLTTNAAASNYQALQVQWKRNLSQGLQALASYTLSHAMDDVTSNFQVTQQLWANSDYDIRNNFQAAITYELPGRYQGFQGTLFSQWALDLRQSARSGTPVDVVEENAFNTSTQSYQSYHPDRIPGVPLYTHQQSVPGGRVINAAAFSRATDGTGNTTEGNAGRNIARTFDMVQTDLALRKDFHIKEGLGLQFRAEAFNLFNHPIYGAVYNQVVDSPSDDSGNSLFGQAYNTLNGSLGGLTSLYQVGGSRSLQVALKLHF